MVNVRLAPIGDVNLAEVVGGFTSSSFDIGPGWVVKPFVVSLSMWPKYRFQSIEIVYFCSQIPNFHSDNTIFCQKCSLKCELFVALGFKWFSIIIIILSLYIITLFMMCMRLVHLLPTTTSSTLPCLQTLTSPIDHRYITTKARWCIYTLRSEASCRLLIVI